MSNTDILSLLTIITKSFGIRGFNNAKYSKDSTRSNRLLKFIIPATKDFSLLHSGHVYKIA
ncbi:hypothetical protein GCM10023092_28050 [Rurimicrobium arvi]|uniref:DUF4372 domain-containing protein n=1 Tax=Rurimicrobium arvi TaxID=2049916 RepID=A0ABP8MZW2_9BACT